LEVPSMALKNFEALQSLSADLDRSLNVTDLRFIELCTHWWKSLTKNLVWCFGLVCVTLISLCAAVGILFIRGLSKKSYNRFITIFAAVGVGSLISSSTLHLVPQGLEIVDGKNFDFITIQMFVIVGIYTFFFCDKFLKISLESKKVTRHFFINICFLCHSSNDKLSQLKKFQLIDAGISESGPTEVNPGVISLRSSDTLVPLDNTIHQYRDRTESLKSRNGIEIMENIDMSRQAHGICVHDHEIVFNHKKDSAIKTVAWMIIFGDGLHNFIDGVSIGAAFNESLISGFSVSVAVFAEEFPHELGDVAILLSAGMSLKQTLFYNLLSTVTCFIGFVIGVMLGSIETFLRYVFGFSGGMFLYIALSCMMPEMKQTMEEALRIGHQEALSVLLLQTLGLTGGTLSMFFFARYGHLIEITGLLP
uniref:Zinc transporter ZIP8 n=1 Tax=Dracunculus medinensis TaxID=318479 RepID=A0A0N4UK30_DRAME